MEKIYRLKITFFDAITSWQTLEHVQDVEKCISEMIRVLKIGGIIHIHCPDYKSTYEGHYRIAWFPMFPKKLAKIYLKLRGNNPYYLSTLNYTTIGKIKSIVKKIAKEEGMNLEIIDLTREIFEKSEKVKKFPILKKFFLFFVVLICI